jgi:hypothetical protein
MREEIWKKKTLIKKRIYIIAIQRIKTKFDV